MKRILYAISLCLLLAASARAQEFEIRRYDLNARIQPAALAVEVEAKMQVVNLSGPDLLDKLLLAGADKPRLSFFLNPKAKIAGVTLNGATIEHQVSEDARNNLLRLSTAITSAIASTREFEIGINYTISAADRNPYQRVTAGESFLLPPSTWVPVLHTPVGDHGADTAPYSLTVTPPPGQKVISGGIRKSETSFEQSLAALPFFIVGDFEVVTRGGDTQPVEVYFQRGLNDMGKQQVEKLTAEAERVVGSQIKYFNYPASAPFRVIVAVGFGATTVVGESGGGRESSYATTGALIIDDSYLRRDVLDLGTIELLASAAARTWVDGRVLLRGRGNGMVRDALPVYLTARYLGERNGEAQMTEAFERYRRGYAPLARGSDGALMLLSPLDRNYRTSMYNKGALVWRMFELQMGRAAFDNLVRGMFARERVDILTLNDWRHPLCTLSRCVSVRSMLAADPTHGKALIETFAQWIETVNLPDFAIGQPQKTENGLESTIVNFGSGDYTVEVTATTGQGEKLSKTVALKAGEYGSVVFPANTEIASLEVDPRKIFVQRDYANDTFPRRADPNDLFGQANLAMSKNDLTTAESKTREAISLSPNSAALKAFLGRILRAQKKLDEAAGTFAEALKSEPVEIQAYAWAHLGLGEIAAEQKKAADAAKHFRLAAASDVDPATTLSARAGLLAAEREAGLIQIPEQARALLKQFDAAILQGSADAINPLIEQGNLRRFAQSLVVRKPSVWQTEALRSEVWDADRVAVDVSLKLRIDTREFSGKALYVLRKSGDRLILSEVPIFDVK